MLPLNDRIDSFVGDEGDEPLRVGRNVGKRELCVWKSCQGWHMHLIEEQLVVGVWRVLSAEFGARRGLFQVSL